jgi:hypothetical protein
MRGLWLHCIAKLYILQVYFIHTSGEQAVTQQLVLKVQSIISAERKIIITTHFIQ